jgi:hypothetical protein
MTLTYFPRLQKTFAIVFGYDKKDIRKFKDRLWEGQDAICSPFFIMNNFIEIEKRHRFAEAGEEVEKLDCLIRSLKYGEAGRAAVLRQRFLYVDEGDGQQQDAVGLYIRVGMLKTGMASWKGQLKSMMLHADDFQACTASFFDPIEYIERTMDEYDLTINKCDVVMNGSTFAFQMVS